jgi:hypothetical protein
MICVYTLKELEHIPPRRRCNEWKRPETPGRTNGRRRRPRGAQAVLPWHHVQHLSRTKPHTIRCPLPGKGSGRSTASGAEPPASVITPMHLSAASPRTQLRTCVLPCPCRTHPAHSVRDATLSAGSIEKRPSERPSASAQASPGTSPISSGPTARWSTTPLRGLKPGFVFQPRLVPSLASVYQTRSGAAKRCRWAALSPKAALKGQHQERGRLREIRGDLPIQQ